MSKPKPLADGLRPQDRKEIELTKIHAETERQLAKFVFLGKALPTMRWGLFFLGSIGLLHELAGLPIEWKSLLNTMAEHLRDLAILVAAILTPSAFLVWARAHAKRQSEDHGRQKDLERLIDSNRTSSNLPPSGGTPPEE